MVSDERKELEERIVLEDRIALQTRTYFSIQHIQSAALFSRECAKIEGKYDGTPPGDLITYHRAYVTAAIFAGVGFLEALVNEIFLDAYLGLPGPNREFGGLPPNIVKAIGAKWDDKFDRLPILDKFQAALSAAQKAPMPKGRAPYQNAKLLIDLRNALIHYKPETITSFSQIPEIPVTIHTFERKLRSKKFSLNPLMPDNAFFPDRCLSHGCAKWAVSSTINFADQFFASLGTQPTFDHVRPQLKLL